MTAAVTPQPPASPRRPPQRRNPDSLRPRDFVLLTAILLLAVALRIIHVADAPLWLDELYSLETTRGQGFTPHTALPLNTIIRGAPDITRVDATAAPWWRIWSMQTTDTHPPLYFILLRAWRLAFGQGDTAARAFSVLASTAAVALLYFLARQIIGPPGAAWAALICAVAPVQIAFAVETRSYAFDTALALATALLLLRVERRGWTWGGAAMLALGLLVMELTHYFTAAAAFAMAAYVTVRFRGRQRVLALATFAAAAALWAALWGNMFLRQAAYVHRNLACLTEPAQGHALLVLGRVATLPVYLLGIPADRPWVYGAAVFYLLPLALLRRRPNLLLPFLWLACGVGLIAAIDWWRCTNQLTFVRYPLIAAPGLYLLIPALLPALRRPWLAHALPLSVALACLFNTGQAGLKWQENWPEITDWMTRKGAQSGDAVVLITGQSDDWELQPSTLYLGVRHFQRQPSLDYLLVSGPPVDPQLVARLARYPRVWVVAAWMGVGPGGLLPGMEPVDASRLERIGCVCRFRPVSRDAQTDRPATRPARARTPQAVVDARAPR